MLKTCALALSVLALPAVISAEDRDTRVRRDRKEFTEDDTWIYNNLERGLAEAKRSGKPLLIVFR